MDNPSALVVPSEITRISPFPSGITLLPSQLGAGGSTPPLTNTYSVSFDGTNDYISIADSPDLSFGDSVNDSPFSISCRVKLNTGYANGGLASKATDANNLEYYITVSHTTKKPFFRIYDQTSGHAQGWTFDTVLSEDVWYHLVFTYDGTGGSSAADGMKCYLDGVELTAKTTANSGSYTAMHNLSSPLNIAALVYAGLFFDGKIDEFAILNTELSAAHVLAIYNFGVPASLASYSPVGWWRMGDNDGGTGTTVTDQGSGGNNGTLTNGPAFSTDVPGAALPELTNTYSVDFDGSNDFMAADGAASAASTFNGGTWLVWIAPDDASPNTSQTIISFGDDNANSFIQISIGGITQTIITASCTLGGTQQWVISTNDLAWSATDWHHVAIVHNGTDATLYIDGVASGFYTLSTNKAIWHNDIAGLDKFTVGAKITNGSTVQYFNGKIDEVAVCETQLTAANLLEIASATTAKATDISSYSPVGWWRMGDNDGGTGTTITDQGSGGNNGTLTNGPTFSTDVS